MRKAPVKELLLMGKDAFFAVWSLLRYLPCHFQPFIPFKLTSSLVSRDNGISEVGRHQQ
jgi:hypothetical protein